MKNPFKRRAEPIQEQQPEQQRGYFDMVAAADVTVSNVATSAVSTVTGPETAMKLAAVYRCVSILSGSIAALPLQMKRKKNGYFAVDEGSKANYLLNKRANRRQNSFELMRNAIIQTVHAGNAYILPRYFMGELSELVLLSPGSVSYDKIIDLYLVSDPVNNIFYTFEAEEIIHLRNVSLDGGYTGVSTIYYASKVLGISASADSQSLDSFQPGATTRGFISGDATAVKGFGEFQDKQLKTVGDRVQEELLSGKKILWVPENMKFNQLSLSPSDIKLLETKEFGVLEICRFYGVHPDKVFAGQSKNYKASEMSQVLFMSDTLQPLLRQIESEFSAKLIPESLSDSYKIEFDIEAMYQTDLVSEAAYMEKTIQNGVYTTNEWRKRKGQAPIQGGDVAMISCNVAPIDSAKIRGEATAKNEPPK